MLDFDTFSKSQFVMIGKKTVNNVTGISSDSSYSTYDATPLDINTIITLRDGGVWRSGADNRLPSLIRSIDYKMDHDFKKMILDQWIESLTLLSTLPTVPFQFTLAIQSPNSDIPIHSHHKRTKQTLTFCFSFDEYRRESDVPSRIILYPEYETPRFFEFKQNSPRTLIQIDENILHSAETKEWRFYWIADFSEKTLIDPVNFPSWDFLKVT
jgi:hypothetical protein